ncbi:hypothetical protein, partial [Fibrobacter succinogenes]|uniref:hypothetical protein n=1 Tax=Fibrobacter succinogenes TaxID=833 RepID=UPI0019D57F1F
MEGSFIQWLSLHKPDWEGNIGKVADEKAVLYSKKLFPSEGKGESLFGVDIDLSSLKTKVRTPEQLMKEKLKLEKERASLNAGRENLLAEKEAEIIKLKSQIA